MQAILSFLLAVYSFPRLKKRFSFILCPPGHLYGLLDAGKVSLLATVTLALLLPSELLVRPLKNTGNSSRQFSFSASSSLVISGLSSCMPLLEDLSMLCLI